MRQGDASLRVAIHDPFLEEGLQTRCCGHEKLCYAIPCRASGFLEPENSREEPEDSRERRLGEHFEMAGRRPPPRDPNLSAARASRRSGTGAGVRVENEVILSGGRKLAYAEFVARALTGRPMEIGGQAKLITH